MAFAQPLLFTRASLKHVCPHHLLTSSAFPATRPVIFPGMASPGVLEYARFHKLAIPHTSTDLSKHLQSLPLLEIDGKGLSDICFPSLKSLLRREKLQLSCAAAQQLMALDNAPEEIRWEEILGDPHRHRRLKVELPLLRRNHERDMRWFKRGVNLQQLIKNMQEDCPSLETGIADQQDFLAHCRQAAESFADDAQYARLQVSRNAVAILFKSTTDAWTEDDLNAAYLRELGGTGVSTYLSLLR